MVRLGFVAVGYVFVWLATTVVWRRAVSPTIFYNMELISFVFLSIRNLTLIVVAGISIDMTYEKY